jgi:FAD dependent oxidoreductase/MatE
MEPGGAELHPLVAAELSRAEVLGRRQANDYARFFRDHLTGCEASYLLDTGVQVGVRQTRQIVGLATLSNSDVVQGRKRADGIARSPWPIELHSGNKPRLEWLYDDFYEVPLGCFVPPHGEGLLAAGRCLSAEHEAMASARVTAQCFSYGHAIGHAAVIALQDRLAVRQPQAAPAVLALGASFMKPLPTASLRELPRLALPLIASSGVQIVLGLTDTWFVGRISTDALAAISSVQWLSLVTILLVGGASLAASVLASQAAGSGRFRRAANAAWTCIWAILFVTPAFVALAWFGGPLLGLLELQPHITALATDYWLPRLLAAPLGLALAVIGGFFNGIGKTQVALVMALVVAASNALLNQLMIFEWGWGIAGAAWATAAAQALGLALLLRYFLNARNRRRYRTHASWRTSAARLRAVYKLGMPLGLLFACDVFAFALFQLLQVKY